MTETGLIIFLVIGGVIGLIVGYLLLEKLNK